MLRVLGHSSDDGLSRRQLLTAGAMALLGAVSGEARPAARRGKAKSVLLIDLFGGPSHIDTFDMKPDAPVELRGEFKPIATSLPGLRVCEHLPRLARLMHRLCLIRTVSHRYNSHNPYAVMTGFDGGNDRENYFAKPTDHPGMGAVCSYLGLNRSGDLPSNVMLPAFPGYSQGLRRAGPYGGYLGAAHDPVFSTCEPIFEKTVDANRDFYDPSYRALGEPKLPPLPGGLTLDAMERRRSLLRQIDDTAKSVSRARSAGVFSKQQERAFALLLSAKAREAFDLGREAPAVRERYGRDLLGQSVLLARRLVEAGVPFVTVHTEYKGNGHWDTHSNNFKMLSQLLLPFLDRSVSALVEDLHLRGLLDQVLLVVVGDMGRTPRVNKNAGRDHWPQCGFCLLAGGGTKKGYVLGTSDKQAAYPLDNPVSAGDLVATVYHQLGVDAETTVPDQTGRPIHISHGGRPVTRVLAF
jgi:hypothetical protein